jgi:hypothetical protein
MSTAHTMLRRSSETTFGSQAILMVKRGSLGMAGSEAASLAACSIAAAFAKAQSRRRRETVSLARALGRCTV